MTILIASDHAILRRGLMQILVEAYPQAQCGEAGTTQETLDHIWKKTWSLVLLDILLPRRGGFEVLHEIKQNHSLLPVLVLGQAPEVELAGRVFKAGAAGYLNLRAAPEEVVKAARTVMAGDRYVSVRTAEKLKDELLRGFDKAPHELLSDREFQVMQMLMAGKSLRAIAAEISLSSKTISTFHSRIWRKLGLHNDVELVRYGLKHGLLESASEYSPFHVAGQSRFNPAHRNDGTRTDDKV